MTNTEKTSGRSLAGKCLCGAVHYVVADEFLYAANCHCSNCRRTTGSAFKPFAGIERDRLHISKGEDHLMIFGDENANDTHCKKCGSLLYSVVRYGAYVHVAMGTLVDDPAIRPTKHIFVGSKARWFTITDDHRGMTAYLHQKHTLAVDLPVEQFVGLVGLIDAPVVGEEFVDVDAAFDRKPRAVRLDDVGERP